MSRSLFTLNISINGSLITKAQGKKIGLNQLSTMLELKDNS